MWGLGFPTRHYRPSAISDASGDISVGVRVCELRTPWRLRKHCPGVRTGNDSGDVADSMRCYEEASAPAGPSTIDAENSEALPDPIEVPERGHTRISFSSQVLSTHIYYVNVYASSSRLQDSFPTELGAHQPTVFSGINEDSSSRSLRCCGLWQASTCRYMQDKVNAVVTERMKCDPFACEDR